VALLVASLPVAIFVPPVGLSMLGAGTAGIIATPAATGKREETVTRKLKKEAEGHFQTLKSLAQSVADAQNDLIENRKEDIIHSPVFEQVLATPSLSEVFRKAAAERLAQYKQEAEAAQKAPEETAKQPAAKHTPSPRLIQGRILK
jgi:hypothetical protein